MTESSQGVPERPALSTKIPPLCDIVMKGGVTSGITYPRAIHEIAQRFHLKNLGGTSAGAIAAAAAAAAEYRRRHSPGMDDMTGFDRLAELPEELGSEGTLVQLFRPDPENRPLFDLGLTAASDEKQRVLRVLTRCFRHWPWSLAIAMLPGLLLLLDVKNLIGGGHPSALVFGSFLGAVFLMAAAFVLMLFHHLKGQLRSMVDNGYGLCSGMAEAPDGESPSLTPWLHAKIQELAGRSDEDDPLTFGDLYAAPRPPAAEGLLRDSDHSIDLKMITTCLTHGRPYEMPYPKKTLYFRYEEMKRLFPDEVVGWMVRNQRPLEDDELPFDLGDWCRMPLPKDLPVVVATRMSLSFPGLISAVPLGKIDFERKLDKGEARTPERILFSDGGISSNFPIHFFDALVPRWPTIAINLRQFSGDPKSDRGARNEYSIYAIQRNQDGLADQWRRIHPGTAFQMLAQFGSSILAAMQNWVDNAHLPLPGYRDRIVEIWQTKQEGGLNLDMPPEVIEALATKGRRAGQLMALRYATPASEKHRLGWDDHRWTRYRSTMAALGEAFGGMDFTLHNRDDWRRMILREDGEPPRSYPLGSRARATKAMEATEGLLDAYDDWLTASTDKFPDLGPFWDPPKPRIKLGVELLS